MKVNFYTSSLIQNFTQIKEIKEVADITVLIPYDRIRAMIPPRITMQEAFEKACEI